MLFALNLATTLPTILTHAVVVRCVFVIFVFLYVYVFGYAYICAYMRECVFVGSSAFSNNEEDLVNI